MDLNERLEEIAAGCLVKSEHFLVAVKTNLRINPIRIVIVVDGDHGVSIDDCATISRSLSERMDEEVEIDDYTLEVTTPGVDQPLKLIRQYVRNKGRIVKVHLKNKDVVRGPLTEVDEDGITISAEKKNGKKVTHVKQNIPFSEIEKTIVQIAFK
ncbi:MAG: ribosome maturation factor RimP [Flammeovirgaceae bacterium]|nr:ribosome maturation factor RimP [Flammeovirgaceae bacterium]